MKNKILFDLSATQPAKEAHFHGGSEYAKYIFIEAVKRGSLFDVCYDSKRDLHEDVKELLRKVQGKLLPFTSNAELEKLILKNEYCVFFSGLPYEYLNFNIPNTRMIYTIHGLRSLELFTYIEKIPYENKIINKVILYLKEIFLLKSRFLKQKRLYQKLVSIPNSHILTVSKHSFYSIASFFPFVNINDITICHPPMNFCVQEVEKNVNKDYFLLVSGDRWSKNNMRAVKALDSLFTDKMLENKRVVVLGCENFDFAGTIKNRDRFEIKGYVATDELNYYMANAYAFIYPTLNEGFGYPPVHAMLYETPVLAAAISSVPEVCEDAVAYFNPYSVYEIRNRILHLFRDKDYKEQLIRKGKDRVKELKILQDSMLEKTLQIIFN